MPERLKTNWGTMVGLMSVAVVPLAFLDRVNRFVLLPELLVSLAGVLVGYAAWIRYGGRAVSRSVVLGGSYLGIQCVAALFAQSPSLSIVPLLTDFAGVSLMALVIVTFSRSDIEKTITAVSIVCGLVSVIGLLQYFGIGRYLIPTSGLPSATLGHRNIAAAYVGGVLPLIAYRFLMAGDRTAIALWSGCGALTLAFSIATRSRAGWVAVLASAVVALVLWLRSREPETSRVTTTHLGAMGGAAVLVVLISLVPADIQRGAGEAMWHEKASVAGTIQSISTEGGDKGRLILWDTTLKMIWNQPIIGVGPGNWRIHYPAYADGKMINANVAPHRAHNDLLQIGAEGGVGAFLVIVALLLWTGYRALANLGGSDRALLVAVAASVAGVVCSSLFGFPREFAGAVAPLWFGLGVIGCVDRVECGGSERRWIPTIGCIVAVLGLGLTVQRIRFDQDVVRARLAMERSDWEGVLLSTERIAETREDESVHLMRGRALQSTGRIEEAEAAFGSALAIHPYAPELWLGMGVAQRHAVKLAESEASFRKATEYDPQDSRALSNLGTLLASQGRIVEAIDLLEQALVAENTPPEIYGNLSAAYRRNGQVEKAIRIAREGLAKGRDVYLVNALGNALAATGDHLKAVDIYEEGLREWPDHPQLLFNLARSYEAQRRSGDAIRAYQGVLKGLDARFRERRAFIEGRITQLEQGRVGP